MWNVIETFIIKLIEISVGLIGIRLIFDYIRTLLFRDR